MCTLKFQLSPYQENRPLHNYICIYTQRISITHYPTRDKTTVALFSQSKRNAIKKSITGQGCCRWRFSLVFPLKVGRTWKPASGQLGTIRKEGGGYPYTVFPGIGRNNSRFLSGVAYIVLGFGSGSRLSFSEAIMSARVCTVRTRESERFRGDAY